MEAQSLIDKLSQDSYNDEIYSIRGRAYAGLGSNDKALRDFMQAIGILSAGSSADPLVEKKTKLEQKKHLC